MTAINLFAQHHFDSDGLEDRYQNGGTEVEPEERDLHASSLQNGDDGERNVAYQREPAGIEQRL